MAGQGNVRRIGIARRSHYRPVKCKRHRRLLASRASPANAIAVVKIAADTVARQNLVGSAVGDGDFRLVCNWVYVLISDSVEAVINIFSDGQPVVVEYWLT